MRRLWDWLRSLWGRGDEQAASPMPPDVGEPVGRRERDISARLEGTRERAGEVQRRLDTAGADVDRLFNALHKERAELEALDKRRRSLDESESSVTPPRDPGDADRPRTGPRPRRKL